MFALALLLRLCLWICCVGCINSLFVVPQFSKYNSILKMSSNDNNNKKVKSTKFDRVIDDFIGKKYGSGQYFYGPRTSGLSEEEIQKRKSYDLKNCVGIHLRGTDRFKTRELKVKRIKQLQLKLISRGLINSKKIIVSDDEEFIKLWKQFDDSPVLSNKIPYIKGAIHLIKCEYTKDELNIQLIIDFITLSFCKEVFSTSEDSRFAKCAQKAKTFF